MNLNTESIVNDVTKVVQNGLKDILSEFQIKYKLYEESHNCVVKMAECMSKQVKQEGTNANVFASVETSNYVSRAEFDALSKQNQELIKHIAYEFELYSKQNQELMNQLAVMKQDMTAFLSREVADITNDSDDETKANITLKIEEIKKETIDNLIGGALDDKVVVVAGDKEESEEEDESEEESDEEDIQEEEEDTEDKPVSPTDKHVLVSTSALTLHAGILSAAVSLEEEEEQEEEEEDEEEEDESDDSDEEKEQLDDDEEVTEDAGGEEEELYEIVFNSTTYCTDDDVKGSLYILTSDGDVGDKVGHLVNGKPIFY
jgi:hypothetical protein